MCAVLILLAMHTATPLTLPIARGQSDAAFPLQVSDSRTYLEDASGRPFLVNGDTAWSLIAQLTREEVETYLADRRRRGFNALLVNLIEHQFATRAPANAYGDRPFTGAAAFRSMNKSYFDHAAWVLERAEERGFVVFLTPAYLGANGGGQGWYLETVAAGNDALRRYGTYVAERFADRRNIVWVHGGDFNAPDKALVRAVVSGIEHAAPNSLHTVHSSRDTATAAFWAGERWLSLDTAYTYDDMRATVLAQTGSGRTMPVIAIEGIYEGEHGAGGETARRQAYAAMLSGAAGHFFGNNPIWHFGGPGLYAADESWQDALDSPGAEAMTHLGVLFEGLPWWLLGQHPGARIDVEGEAYLASTPDGSFQIAYLFGAGGVTFDPAMTGRPPEMRWFDPSSGRWYAPPPFDSGVPPPTLRPPASGNAAGDRDWVLVVRFDP